MEITHQNFFTEVTSSESKAKNHYCHTTWYRLFAIQHGMRHVHSRLTTNVHFRSTTNDHSRQTFARIASRL